MGWKNVKNHFDIKHFVTVHDGKLRIGSPYINDIMIIAADGTIEKDYTSSRGVLNDDLARYEADIRANKDKFAELFASPDSFERDIKVYTYDSNGIVERLCETPDWPNVTHDGRMMYENTYSTDYAKTVSRARRDAELGVLYIRRRIAEAAASLEAMRTGQFADALYGLGRIDRGGDGGHVHQYKIPAWPTLPICSIPLPHVRLMSRPRRLPPRAVGA